MVKNLPATAGDIRDIGLIPGLGRSTGEGYDNLLQYSFLDRGAGQVTVHRIAKRHDCATFTFHFHFFH